jgi:hypothetical protein
MSSGAAAVARPRPPSAARISKAPIRTAADWKGSSNVRINAGF